MKNNSRKLKILIVASPWLGGSGTVAFRLAESLIEKGYEVHFITYDIPQDKGNRYSRIKIHVIKPFSYNLFPFPLNEMSLAEKIIEISILYGIDIIHAHYGTLFGHASVLAMNYFDSFKKRPKLVITFHGTDVIGNDPLRPGINVTKYLQKTIIRKADAVTVVSKNLEQLMRKIYGVSRTIQIIRNGISVKSYVGVEKASRLDQFVHISNFRKIKNIPTIIRAFSKFSKTNKSYKLKLVGTGPELEKIKSMVSSYQINSRVSFLGVLSEERIYNILSRSRALILPSLYESSGLVVFESFKTATPVIASRVGGIPEIICHNKEGILIDKPGSVEQLSRAMKAMIQSDAKYNDMSRRALMKASSCSFDKIVNEYIGLYDSL